MTVSGLNKDPGETYNIFLTDGLVFETIALETIRQNMKKAVFAFCTLIIGSFGGSLSAQCGGGTFKVLHYTETTGYDHNTRNQSLSMFQGWETAEDYIVTSDDDGAEFNSLSNLEQYAVVIFSNTSGNSGLDATQRANFEAYINGGGSYLGIHAASDTYRHSTANGNKTGTWDWYAENVAGASVQESPNHTSNNHNNTMTHQQVGHPTLVNVPDPWNKTEEYYYWENGYLNNSFLELLQVASTGGNSYDAPRMMAHCKNLSGGGRAFYTALGHSGNNYTGDQNFQNLMKDALLWAAEPNIPTGGGNITADLEILSSIDCFGEQGELKVTPTSGTAPYTYAWSTGGTSQSLTAGAGDYSVTVTDADGCTVTKSEKLSEPDELKVTLSADPNTSATGNGDINTIISGGTKPYSYDWTGPDNFTSTVKYPTGLKAGTYVIVVTDDLDCMATASVVVEENYTASIEDELGITNLVLQPNPASTQATLILETQRQVTAGFNLLDLQGRVVAGQQPTVGLAFEWQIDLSDIPAGYYLASIQVEHGVLIKKLVVR